MNVVLHPYGAALASPVTTSAGVISERRGVLVQVEDGGVSGWGDAAPLPGWPGGSLADVHKVLEAWQASASGDVVDLSALRDLPIARSAIDTALSDQRARVAGLSLARQLSPAAVGTVAVNVLIDLQSEAQVETDVLVALDSGFGTFKAKVGVRPIAEEGLLLRRLRSTVGLHAAIRIDANQAWSPAEAESALRSLAAIGIEYVEEPTADAEAWPGLRDATGVPIAGDESVGNGSPLELAAYCDVMVLKVPLLGGPTATVATAQQLRQAGIDVVITSFLDNAVGVATAAHVASALGPVSMAHGLATSGRLANDVGPALPIAAGRMTLAHRPGLGFDPVV